MRLLSSWSYERDRRFSFVFLQFYGNFPYSIAENYSITGQKQRRKASGFNPVTLPVNSRLTAECETQKMSHG